MFLGCASRHGQVQVALAALLGIWFGRTPAQRAGAPGFGMIVAWSEGGERPHSVFFCALCPSRCSGIAMSAICGLVLGAATTMAQ